MSLSRSKARARTTFSSAISVYFSDPYGNLLEVTTYDAEAARIHLHSKSIT